VATHVARDVRAGDNGLHRIAFKANMAIACGISLNGIVLALDG
jgi:hypothetical protein